MKEGGNENYSIKKNLTNDGWDLIKCDQDKWKQICNKLG